MTDIISGERLQSLCSIYCGLAEDFDFNPYIQAQTSKHLNIDSISHEIDNPFLVFCYAHRLHAFGSKIHFFKNRFVLITHNSDENITDQYRYIIDNDKIVRMYSQNVMFDHPKLWLIPIGIANSMWPHGNISSLLSAINSNTPKSKDVYFYFNIYTNVAKRLACKTSLESRGLSFGYDIQHHEYIRELASYKFAICPEGNGIDSHRIWECFYLNVIPILPKNTFTLKVQEMYPCIVLDSWDQYDHQNTLASYDDLYTRLQLVKNTLNFSYYETMIRNGMTFDIVIPVGPNEYSKLPTQIEYTKKNIIGYRNIYVVSKEPSTPIEGVINIEESIFPFSIDTIAQYHGASSRNGWYLQQLIKLYAGFVIPGILSSYLVLDADTYFLRPVSFIENGVFLFNIGTEYHGAYFEHMNRLHPSLFKRFVQSGITHHMMMNTLCISKLFKMVEENHNGTEFWKVFLKQVEPSRYQESGASEYEMYFTYMLTHNLSYARIRPLKWRNAHSISSVRDEDLDYVSCHWYIKE